MTSMCTFFKNHDAFCEDFPLFELYSVECLEINTVKKLRLKVALIAWVSPYMYKCIS